MGVGRGVARIFQRGGGGGHGHPRTPLATPLVGKDPSQKKEPQGSAYGNHDIPVSGLYHMTS